MAFQYRLLEIALHITHTHVHILCMFNIYVHKHMHILMYIHNTKQAEIALILAMASIPPLW